MQELLDREAVVVIRLIHSLPRTNISGTKIAEASVKGKALTMTVRFT